MKTNFEHIELATVGNGDAPKLFNAEVKKVLDNIMDKATNASAKREITMKFEFCPTDDRDNGFIHISCSSKVAPPVGASGLFYVRNMGGKITGYTRDPEQTEMFNDKE